MGGTPPARARRPVSDAVHAAREDFQDLEQQTWMGQLCLLSVWPNLYLSCFYRSFFASEGLEDQRELLRSMLEHAS